MTSVTAQLDTRELALDKQAASAINFCSLWPTAKPILQQLSSVISSSMVKFAITTVIAAGDAYCPSAPITKTDILSQLRNKGINSLEDLADYGVNKASGSQIHMDSFIAPSFVAN